VRIGPGSLRKAHMGNDEDFPNLLRGRLWHTTSSDRYQQIVESGFILPNPPVPDDERWGTIQGPDYYPYVRFLGGVSLFDFNGFDPESYGEKYPLSTWIEFVPYRRQWGKSVWIEINRQRIIDNFISGDMLLTKWKQSADYRHPIMPCIEAAHLGPISMEAFNCVFICGDDTEGFEEVLR